MTETRVTFPGHGLTLEGVLHKPDAESPAGVVVCHPHPLYGGDMSNNLVVAMCRALAQKSLLALRFNFRGVGRSQGSYDNGQGEREDAFAALDFLAAEKGVKRVGLTGYSFGASVAVPVAVADRRVAAAAAISLPLEAPGLEPWRDYRLPKLIASGGRDAFAPVAELERQFSSLPEPKELFIVPEADHFWWGHEADLSAKVADFFARALAEEQDR